VDETRRAIEWGDLTYWTGLLALGIQAEADLAVRARAAGRLDEVARARVAAEEMLGSRAVNGSLRGYGFEDPVGEPAPPQTQAHWALGDAELARLAGKPRPELWAAVAARWDRLSFPYQAAYARLREAEARLDAGDDRAAAAVALRAAHATLVRLGAAPLREAAEALGRRARIALAAPDATPPAERPFDLTERELTVLERLAAGQTNRRIADELYLSTRTVDMHVRNILSKLNAANRVEAAATAHRHGIGRDTAVLP
jgi:DNA-binding CsgD family transcriptional regulator